MESEETINLQEVEVTKGGERLNMECQKRAKVSGFLV